MKKSMGIRCDQGHMHQAAIFVCDNCRAAVGTNEPAFSVRGFTWVTFSDIERHACSLPCLLTIAHRWHHARDGEFNDIDRDTIAVTILGGAALAELAALHTETTA